jgi:hypothetical protein
MGEVRGYKTIPVDPETYGLIRRIAEIRGLGMRGNGAVVRQAVRTEFQKLMTAEATETGQGGPDTAAVPQGA